MISPLPQAENYDNLTERRPQALDVVAQRDKSPYSANLGALAPSGVSMLLLQGKAWGVDLSLIETTGA